MMSTSNMAARPIAPEVVATLKQYRLPSNELKHGEYAYRIRLTKSASRKQKTKYSVDPAFFQILSALLNTCGGIIKVLPTEGDDKFDDKMLATWKTDLEGHCLFIPKAVFQECVVPIPTENGNGCVYFIHKAREFVTFDSHLYTRQSAYSLQVSEPDAISEILSKNTGAPNPTILDDIQCYRYLDKCKYPEESYREFKHSQSGTCSYLIASLTKGRTLRAMLAMGNLAGGGEVIFGVENESNLVLGQEFGETIDEVENNKEEFERELETLLTQNDKWRVSSSSSAKRCWAVSYTTIGDPPFKCNPVCRETCANRLTHKHHGKTEPRHNGIGNEEKKEGSILHNKLRVVIHIRFDHCPGGVFEAEPEAFIINDDGHICRLPFEEWRRKHTDVFLGKHPVDCICDESDANPVGEELDPSKAGTSADTDKHQLGDTSSVDSTVDTQVANEGVRTGMADHKDALASDSDSQLNNASPSNILMYKEHSKFEFSKHSSHPRAYTVKQDQTRAKRHRSELFTMCKPIGYRPPRKVIDCLLGSSDLLADIDQDIPEAGSGISVDSIFSYIEHSTEDEVHKPPHHKCDILVLSEIGTMVLFVICSVFGSPTEESQQKVYTYILARILKKKLLESLASTVSYRSISMHCRIITLDGTRHATSQIYSKWLEIPSPQQFEDIAFGLETVLSKKRTWVHDVIVHGMDWEISEEQMNVLLSIDRSRFNIIEGPPGCGKTHLAQFVCEMRGKSTSAYITSSKPLYNLVKSKGKAAVYLAEDGAEVLELLSGSLKEKLCVVIDDNQTFPYDSEKTFEDICDVIQQRQSGQLCFFQDSRYQNYTRYGNEHLDSDRGMPQYINFKHILMYGSLLFKTMNEIRRNSRAVGSFIEVHSSEFESNTITNEIKCFSRVEGDDVTIHHVPTLRDPTNNGLLKHVRELIDTKAANSQGGRYTTRDVAVLTHYKLPNASESEAMLFRDIFNKNWNESNVQSAEQQPVNGIIIDSLDNFMGLEAPLVIFVMPKKTIIGLKERIAIASRGTLRVDFLHEDILDSDLMQIMKYDRCPKDAVISSITREEMQRSTMQNTQQEKQECRQLYIQLGDEIKDMCFVEVGEVTVHLCTLHIEEHWKLQLVSDGAERVNVTVDDPGMLETWWMASSDEGRHVAVAGTNDEDDGPWLWAVYRTGPGRIEHVNTFQLDVQPGAMGCTPDGDVIILLWKEAGLALAKLSQSTGRELWCHGQDITRLRNPRRVSVCPGNGYIYVSDRNCVRELGPDGQHTRNISTPGVDNPWALTVDSEGRYLFIADYHDQERDNIFIYMANLGGGSLENVITSPGRVLNLRLHRNRYLGVVVDEGLVLYDVAHLLS